jgi:hypothetical protein
MKRALGEGVCEFDIGTSSTDPQQCTPYDNLHGTQEMGLRRCTDCGEVAGRGLVCDCAICLDSQKQTGPPENGFLVDRSTSSYELLEVDICIEDEDDETTPATSNPQDIIITPPLTFLLEKNQDSSIPYSSTSKSLIDDCHKLGIPTFVPCTQELDKYSTTKTEKSTTPAVWEPTPVPNPELYLQTTSKPQTTRTAATIRPFLPPPNLTKPSYISSLTPKSIQAPTPAPTKKILPFPVPTIPTTPTTSLSIPTTKKTIILPKLQPKSLLQPENSKSLAPLIKSKHPPNPPKLTLAPPKPNSNSSPAFLPTIPKLKLPTENSNLQSASITTKQTPLPKLLLPLILSTSKNTSSPTKIIPSPQNLTQCKPPLLVPLPKMHLKPPNLTNTAKNSSITKITVPKNTT